MGQGRTVKTRSSRAIYSYWNERRGSRLAPERGEIEPGAIRGALSDSFILSCDPDYPFRLAGTRVCALFGRELKGDGFAGLWAPASMAPVRDLMAGIVEDTVGAVAGLTGLTADGERCPLELLLLPLYHRGKTHVRLLGVLAPPVQPDWLGANQIATLDLGAVRYLGAAITPFAPRFSAPRSETARPIVHARRGLVVYEGGRN